MEGGGGGGGGRGNGGERTDHVDDYAESVVAF